MTSLMPAAFFRSHFSIDCGSVSMNKPRCLVAFVVAQAATLAIAAFYYRQSHFWIATASESMGVMEWNGFGPERGNYSYTVVTALLDIGRAKWRHQSRPYHRYLLYMQGLLKMDVNLIIFIDDKGVPFVDWMRRGRANRTRIVPFALDKVPYFRYRDRIQEIMDSPEYQKDNELVRKQLCESYVPEYDILQLSKLFFIERAIDENPFRTSYFMWMDAGYGKGKAIYPPDNVWRPKHLLEFQDKITLLERPPGVEAFRASQGTLHKQSINILPGGFFGGGSEAFKEMHRLQQTQLHDWLDQAIIDDDQTMNMALYFRRPGLFRLVPGDWYDTFNRFS